MVAAIKTAGKGAFFCTDAGPPVLRRRCFPRSKGRGIIELDIRGKHKTRIPIQPHGCFLFVRFAGFVFPLVFRTGRRAFGGCFATGGFFLAAFFRLTGFIGRAAFAAFLLVRRFSFTAFLRILFRNRGAAIDELSHQGQLFRCGNLERIFYRAGSPRKRFRCSPSLLRNEGFFIQRFRFRRFTFALGWRGSGHRGRRRLLRRSLTLAPTDRYNQYDTA